VIVILKDLGVGSELIGYVGDGVGERRMMDDDGTKVKKEERMEGS